MLNELLDLIDPLRLEHVFLDALDGDHQTRHVLDQDIIARDQQLIRLALVDARPRSCCETVARGALHLVAAFVLVCECGK